jgi:hypothetical protein
MWHTSETLQNVRKICTFCFVLFFWAESELFEVAATEDAAERVIFKLIHNTIDNNTFNLISRA